MKDDFINCSDLIMKVADITTSTNNMSSVWKKVVLRIKSNSDSDDNEKKMPLGERLAGNTRVIDVKNGVMLIESDHPGWVQYLRFYQKFIIKGLNMELPDLKIKSLAFRITGSTYGLSDVYYDELEKAQKQMTTKADETDKELETIFGENNQTEEDNIKAASILPPEILQKFENIRQSIEEDEK